LGEDIDVLFDFIHSGDLDKREHARKVYRDGEMKEGMDRVSGDYNDFWAGRDYLNNMGPMKAALLMSHGFNDWNVMPEQQLPNLRNSQSKRFTSTDFLSPKWAWWATTNAHDESLVYALFTWCGKRS
jgi:X-Pro dipeptidyl-peptidase